MLTLEEFVQSTKAVLEVTPLDEFEPTLVDRCSDEVRVLSGIPSGVPQTDAVRDWLARLQLTHYIVAFQQANSIGIELQDDEVRHCFFLKLHAGEWSVESTGPIL